MTSSSYASATSLRRTTTVFHQRLVPTARLRRTVQTFCTHPNRQLSILSISDPNAYEENPSYNLTTGHNNACTSSAAPFASSLASRSTTWNKVNVYDKSFAPFHNPILAQCDVVSSKTITQSTGKLRGLLCSDSYQENHHPTDRSLKIAPTRCSSVRNISAKTFASRSKSSVMKVSYPATAPAKSGESSWLAFYNQGNRNGTGWPTSAGTLPEDSLTRIFQAVYNYQCHRDFLIKKFSLGKRAMSMSLLLDPIIGSPPSALSSPLVEARDDISALSEGFTRKIKFQRRRLSTSFDEPSNSDYPVRVISGDAASVVPVDHAGPFGFRSSGVSKQVETLQTTDCEEKKAKLNAWLEQLHQEAICKADSKASENSFSNSSGSGHGSSHDDDGHGSSKSASPALKISEDLFQLLEKVIGYKGRSISHITVEQSVKYLCTVYIDANDEEKIKFFTILAEKYGVDQDYVTTTARNLVSCQDSEVRITLEEKLRGALVPKSQWLFTQIGRLENGVKFLVDMRVDLLDAIETAKGKSTLKSLNNSLRDLIGMWFNVGFLNLERVTWQSSCDMLQKISEYEAVHPMRNWTDLKKRVGPNRRCFVFTHNSMPGEPVVVLHTFLTDHIASSVQKIVSNHRMRMMSLDSDLPMSSTTEDPDTINTAVFYSITSTQRGLTGIELGNYLIKRVVRELQSEFPKMTQFSTLSPIPGFKNWLVSCIRTALKDPSSNGKPLFTEDEITSLKPIFESYDKEKHFNEVFLDLLKLNSWFSDERLVKELEKPLMRLCAQYLYLVKRRGYALDPVANFHLKNGAVIWRINWLGDESPRGLGQSCGMMVNYRYFLETCESNSQNYMENQVIEISDQVNHYIKLTSS